MQTNTANAAKARFGEVLDRAVGAAAAGLTEGKLAELLADGC